MRYIWVVRLVGPLRAEVYEPGKPMQRVDGDGELRAPGVLQNAYTVRSLVDPQLAMEVSLHNLLSRKGYSSIDEILAKGEARGEAIGRQQGEAISELRGLQRALLTLLQARELSVTPEDQARISACIDDSILNRWLARAATAAAVDAVFTD